jgi:hypothetical protein
MFTPQVFQFGADVVGLLLLLLFLIIGIAIIAFVVKLFFFLVPAAAVALIVWWITGSPTLTGIAFLIIAAISLFKRH